MRNIVSNNSWNLSISNARAHTHTYTFWRKFYVFNIVLYFFLAWGTKVSRSYVLAAFWTLNLSLVSDLQQICICKVFPAFCSPTILFAANMELVSHICIHLHVTCMLFEIISIYIYIICIYCMQCMYNGIFSFANFHFFQRFRTIRILFHHFSNLLQAELVMRLVVAAFWGMIPARVFAVWCWISCFLAFCHFASCFFGVFLLLAAEPCEHRHLSVSHWCLAASG